MGLGNATFLRLDNENVVDLCTYFSEFTISTTEEYKDNRLKLSEPVSIKRGDVIAFHASTDATAAKLLAGNGSYVLAYCGQTFKEGDEVLVSNGRKWLHTMFWIRLHLAVSQILEIPIEPKIPNVPFAFNISASGGNKNTLEEVVDVEVTAVNSKRTGMLTQYNSPYNRMKPS